MMQLPDKDNELDDLIKAAADKHKVPGANPDWDKMETMLDTHMPLSKRPQRKRWYFLLIPLFLLLGGAYLYFGKINNKLINPAKEPQAAGKSTSPILANTVTDTTTVEVAGENKKLSEPFLKNTAKLSTIATSRSFQKAAANIKNITTGNSNKYSASLLQHKKTVHQNVPVVNDNNFTRLQNKSKGSLKTSITQSEVSENNVELEKTKEEIPAVSKNESATTIHAKTPADSAQNKIAGIKNTTSPHKKTTVETVPEKKKTEAALENTAADKINADKRKNPWEFSLLYAPELTTINFNNIDKPGSNYGILAGYTISKNFSIQTGIIKSKKNYTANGVDYKSGYSVMLPFKLTRVKGYCDMYEIPVNIKYDLLHRKNMTVSAIAGISSYFMTGEYYAYQYNSYDSAYYRSREYGSQKNYWMALATIAIGFEKQISNNVSVGASPFLKIPFKGMGSGDLKLLGTGVNFSLSYRHAFKK